jgi:Fe-S oxidoreductase
MGITEWFKGQGKTLYYPGCLTKGILKQELENYKTIFNKLGIDFVMLPNDEVCCGLPVLNAGHKKEAKKLAQKNFDLFKKYNIKRIVTNCPSCYHTFNHLYPELIKGWNIETEHVTRAILSKLKDKIKNLNFEQEEVVCYHDPCHLGRYSEVYEEPREVIKLLGGKIEEMKHNKETSLCCGGGGGVRANFKELAIDIAKKRIQEMPKNAEKIISPCGLCFANLKSATDKSEEFSSFVLRKLKEGGF